MLRTFGLPVLLLCLAWFSAASLGQAESEPNRRESDGAEEPVPGAEEPTTDAEAVDGPVIPIALRIRVDSPIHPVAAQYIQDSLAEAESREAEVLVVQLDTPGGLLTSTRDITQAFLSSPVPVAVFVSPGGAQAASAGFFLLMAADFAAMAPGTPWATTAAIGGRTAAVTTVAAMPTMGPKGRPRGRAKAAATTAATLTWCAAIRCPC